MYVSISPMNKTNSSLVGMSSNSGLKRGFPIGPLLGGACGWIGDGPLEGGWDCG